MSFEKCSEYHDTRKVCIASENGKTYKLENLSGLKIRKLKVDKCFSQKTGQKICDYIMSIEGEEIYRSFFIELKGSGLDTALQQILSTIEYFNNDFNGYRLEARIVGTRDIPRFLNSIHYRKLASKVYSTGGSIVRATNSFYLEKV